MTTVVAVAVLARRSQRPRPHPASVALTAAPSEAPAPGPVGPTPPPEAVVPEHAARVLHGGPRRTHRAPGHGPRTIKVGFRVAVDGGVAAQVTASPDESTLYVATLGGKLVALAKSDGARRWSVDLGDRGYATPLVHEDGTIYAGTDAKKLFAVSPTGASVFKLDVEGEADSGATFAPDGTIVFAAGKQVHAVRRGGDLAWRFAARGKVFTAPAITGEGLVVFGAQDHRVYALGPGGVLAWQTDLGADVDGAPAIGDDDAIYVGTDGGEVVRLDAKGSIVWRVAVGGFVRGSLSIARNGDVLVGTYGPAPRLVRIAPEGRIRGALAIAGTGAREFGIHGGPLEDGEGALFFGTQDDCVYALEPDGRERWRFSTGGDVDAPLTLLADGSLVVPSEDGTVTLLLP